MFDEYLADLPEDRQQALREVLAEAAAVAPEATEGRSYGAPALRYRDRPLLGSTVSKRQLSVYCFSPDIIAEVAPLLDGFSVSKGTIRFTPDHPVPAPVIREMVRRRTGEIDGA